MAMAIAVSRQAFGHGGKPPTSLFAMLLPINKEVSTKLFFRLID